MSSKTKIYNLERDFSNSFDDEVITVILHAELHNLYYASLSIITMINSRRMKWTWQVTCMEEMRNAQKSLESLGGKPEGLAWNI